MIMRDDTIRIKNQGNQGTYKEITLLNFHMFKTAARDLDKIIKRQFPKDTIYFFEVGGSPEKVKNSISIFQRLSDEEKQKIRFVYGGPFFGLHEYFPGPCAYVTLVHHPVKRVILEYYHILRNPLHPAHSEVMSKNMTLEDYARNGVWLAWNGQTRFIRGAPGGWFKRGPVQISTKDLEIAKANLREYFICGLTERFVESLILLKRALGWKILNILYVRQPRGSNLPPRDNISSETMKLIEEHNKLDLELYEFAKQMFEERISQQDSSFKRELQNFQLCNKTYGFFMHLGGTILQFAIRIFKAVTKKRQ